MEQHPEAIDLDSNESLNLEGDRTTNLMRSSPSKVESLKRMVKFIIIVSVCVFCLGLALFFPLFSLFPHHYHYSFNHALERKYMFLICNGILFLLPTSSSVLEDSSSSSFGTCNSFSHSDGDQFDQHLIATIDEYSNSVEEEEEEEEEQNQEMEIEEEEEVEDIIGCELEEELDEEDEGCFTDEVEEEEERLGSELEVVVSTEELNKKIEEFIRKMKEEMRIEAAQTQLIAV